MIQNGSHQNVFKCYYTFITLFTQCHGETLVFNVKRLFLNGKSKNS